MKPRFSLSSFLLTAIVSALILVIYQQSCHVDELEEQARVNETRAIQIQQVIDSQDSLLLAVEKLRDFERKASQRSKQPHFGLAFPARPTRYQSMPKADTQQRERLQNELRTSTLVLLERREDLRVLERRLQQ